MTLLVLNSPAVATTEPLVNIVCSTMKVFITLALLYTCLFISCSKDDPEISEEDKLTVTFSTMHFDYFQSKSDPDKIDTIWQESYYEWLVGQLNLTIPEKILYHKYRDQAHKKRLTGKLGNGFAELGTFKIHTIWDVDNHECVHIIVTQAIGHPPAIFNEGIAVAYQANYFKYPEFLPDWNGQDFNLLSKNYQKRNDIPSLDKLLGIYSFWDYSPDITYPVSGSFVRYLIDRYGIVKMKSFISKSDYNDPKDKIRIDFYNIYGFSLENGWAEWVNFIANYQE